MTASPIDRNALGDGGGVLASGVRESGREHGAGYRAGRSRDGVSQAGMVSVGHGMQCVMETTDGIGPVRTFAWGLDVAGRVDMADSPFVSMAGAGGVGGLLAASDLSETYCYAYDGNGNVMALVDAAGDVAGEYRYGPYGQTRTASETGIANPFRFSTKFLETAFASENETLSFGGGLDLYDYGFRWYHAGLGRWTARDPIGEMGGVNTYMWVMNNPADDLDVWGYFKASIEVSIGLDTLIDNPFDHGGPNLRFYKEGQLESTLTTIDGTWTAPGNVLKLKGVLNWTLDTKWYDFKRRFPSASLVRARGVLIPGMSNGIFYKRRDSSGRGVPITASDLAGLSSGDLQPFNDESGNGYCIQCIWVRNQFTVLSFESRYGNYVELGDALSIAVAVAGVSSGQVWLVAAAAVGDSILNLTNTQSLVVTNSATVVHVICADGDMFNAVYGLPQRSVIRWTERPLVRKKVYTWMGSMSPGGRVSGGDLFSGEAVANPPTAAVSRM